MIRIDGGLLDELGLAELADLEKNKLLKQIYDTLERRVGMRLVDQMSKAQLDDFGAIYEAKDSQAAFAWLETQFPKYKDAVREEFETLKLEVSAAAPAILAAAGT